MSIERDQDFEQLEDIAAMMAENPGIEFENGKYVYYGLDGRTAFAAVYISGAWSAWQAKANAVLEDFNLWWENNAIAMMCEEDEALKIWKAAQAVPENKKFNLDEFLSMEEKLKSKDGVIAADLDRFVAYAEMVLEKAKALKEPK